MLKVEKRNGMIVNFEGEKIVNAICKAMAETELGVDETIAKKIADKAFNTFSTSDLVHIEKIQDFVEIELMGSRPDVAKKYILYRDKRARLENMVGNVGFTGIYMRKNIDMKMKVLMIS